MKIYVKNMACDSCLQFVRDTLVDMDIATNKLSLGEIDTKADVTDTDKKNLDGRLRKVGLELLEKKKGILVEKMKKVIIDHVYKHDSKSDMKFSGHLSKELGLSYTYLANFFSEVEATTIEQYIIALKIERVKELIIFGEDTFSEIAYKLNYSSSAHLSSQFKKVTGLTPSHFKNLKEKRRLTIQSI